MNIEYLDLIVVADLENSDQFAIVPRKDKYSNMHTRYGVCGRKQEAVLFSKAPKLLRLLQEALCLHCIGERHDEETLNFIADAEALIEDIK